jgi:hypothetical protein
MCDLGSLVALRFHDKKLIFLSEALRAALSDANLAVDGVGGCDCGIDNSISHLSHPFTKRTFILFPDLTSIHERHARLSPYRTQINPIQIMIISMGLKFDPVTTSVKARSGILGAYVITPKHGRHPPTLPARPEPIPGLVHGSLRRRTGRQPPGQTPRPSPRRESVTVDGWTNATPPSR